MGPRRHVTASHACVRVRVYMCGADLPGVSRDLKGCRGNPLSCTVYWGVTGRVDKSFVPLAVSFDQGRLLDAMYYD